MENNKEVHLNDAQLKSVMVQPNREIVIIGRGGGKTQGIQAPFVAANAIAMPRSTQRLASYTYEGLLTNILPGIISGWEEMNNWREGVHFFVGQWAPKSWDWHRPYFKTQGDAKHIVHIYNGSVIQLASMDRSINNGASIDSFSLDEARLVRRKKVAEMIPAMRGNLTKFGHLSNYQSMLMTSDMPQLPSEKWLLDYEDQNSQALIDGILDIQQYMCDSELVQRYQKANGTYKKQLELEINYWHKELNRLRMDCTMFMEASTLENLEALGRKAILNMKETLSDQEFAVAVLNQRRDKVLNGFYAALDPEVHSYDGRINYDLFDGVDDVHRNGYSKDSRMDSDYFDNEPLHLAFDHNAAINSAVIGQPRGKKEMHVLNTMYVKQPKYLTDLINNMTEYYRHAKNKTAIYYYDATSIKEDSRGNPSESTTVISLLSRAGWKVRGRYLGRTARHDEKYRVWQSVLSENHPAGALFKYNRVNCMNMEKSMLNADVRMSGDEYRKDKRSEQKDYTKGEYKVPPEEATHISEAADTLLIGWLDDTVGSSIFSAPVTA